MLKIKEIKPEIGLKRELMSQNILSDLNFAIKNGFNCLEIGLNQKPNFNPSLKLSQQIKNISERNNLLLIVHVPYYLPTCTTISEISETVIKIIKREIILARRLGAKIITLHSGAIETNPDKNFKALTESLKKIIRIGKEYQVKIGLENSWHLPGLCRSPEDLLRVTNSVKGLGITFDVGHANIQNVDLIKPFRRVRKFLANVHIHDNDGKTDQHAVIGEGSINFKGFLKECKNSNYYGPFILEMFPRKNALKGKEIFLNLWNQI